MSKEAIGAANSVTKSETSGNESRESGSKVFTFVYRGNNPYLDKLAAELQTLGHTVTIHKVDAYAAKADYAQLVAAFGNLEGKVIADHTLINEVRNVAGEGVVDAYELLEWKVETAEDVSERVRPIVEDLRSSGHEPVALQKWLGDHISLEMSEDGRIKDSLAEDMKNSSELKRLSAMDAYGEQPMGRDAANYYAAILAEKLNVPIISRDVFPGNVPEILEKMGIDSTKAVLLVDHHVYEMRSNVIEARGLDKIEIVPVCPCCIGNNATYLKSLEQAGFKLYPLSYEGEVAGTAAKLAA